MIYCCWGQFRPSKTIGGGGGGGGGGLNLLFCKSVYKYFAEKNTYCNLQIAIEEYSINKEHKRDFKTS